MPLSASFIKLLDKVEPELRDVLIAFYEEIERQRLVTKDEFNELKDIVNELSRNLKILSERFESFQRTTEENFNRVWKAIGELAEAQRKTEERLNQLAERVDQLTERVDQLTESVSKLTERVDQLTERVNQLAEAQRKTENEIAKLARGLEALRNEVGGLSHTVGYRLEDEAMKSLPSLLARDFGIEVIGKMRRDSIEISPGRYIEVNIIGEAKKDGRDYIIIGEAKSQLKKRDVDEFIKKAEKIREYIPKDQIQVLITYQTSPIVKNYAIGKGIKLYFSYEL